MTDTIAQAELTPPDERYLKSAPIMRAIVHLCLPMMAAMAAGTIYTIVNAYFIGTQDDTGLLAALTFALPVYIIAFAVGGVFGAGGSAYIARLLGGGERDRIGSVSTFTIYGGLIAGVLVAGAGLALLGPLVSLLGADPSSIMPTTDYVRVLLYFTPAFIVSFAAEQIVRATGATRQSMYGLLISTVANFALDLIFIIGLHMGVVGAGLALGISNLLAIAYYLIYLHLRQPLIKLNPRHLRVSGTLLREVLGVGSSELIQSAFLLVSAIILNNVAVTYGPAFLAAFGVAFRITQLPEALTMGVSLGMLPLFAYAAGANDHARLRAALRGAALWIAGLTLLFGLPVFLARDMVFQLFSTDAAVIEDGALVLLAMLVSTLFNGYTGLILAYFQGTGRAKAAAALSLALGGLFIPAIVLGNLWFGKVGVAWSLTATELACCALGLILIRFAKGRQGPTALTPTVSEEIQRERVGGALSI